MDTVIEALDAEPARARERELIDILVDCVDDGASVGFLPPLAAAEASRRRRTTLVLDTREGDPSERLYRSLGWQLAGVIPRYARSANGALDGSAFYYKLLGPAT